MLVSGLKSSSSGLGRQFFKLPYPCKTRPASQEETHIFLLLSHGIIKFLPQPKRTITLVGWLTPSYSYYKHLLPSNHFHVLFNTLFRVLFTFPSRYLFAIGLIQIFSFRSSIRPILGCVPKQPDSSITTPYMPPNRFHTGVSPSLPWYSYQLKPIQGTSVVS